MNEHILQQLEKGYRHQQSGDLRLAERTYLRVLKKDPANIHALNLLGVLCVNSSRPREAITYLNKALKQHPDDAETRASIALAYKDIGNLKEAASNFRISIRLAPANPVTHNNLGNVLRSMEKPKDAAESFGKALKIQPDYAECWSNLAAALNDTGEYEEAMRAAVRAIQLQPAMAQAYNNLGDIFLGEAQYAEAFESYQKACELSPKYTIAIINMAKAQRDLDLPEDALETLAKVLEIEPRNPEAHLSKGVLLEQMGDRGAAAESFKKAIESVPELANAHYQLSQIKGRDVTDSELDTMLELGKNPKLTQSDKMYLAFGLCRAYEQREDYDKAYEHLSAGNKIKAENSPYSDKDAGAYLESLTELTQIAIQQMKESVGLADERPVFVLGMPRSGTSLTEQILASHSEVAGAGERSYAFDTAKHSREITKTLYPRSLKLLPADKWEELGRYYLSRHSEDDLKHRYVVDKTPLNFQYLGMLALALPNARFIHCHRNPVQNCFSIHKLPFDRKQTYAHDLEALGLYYSRYWSLMNRWKEMFPGRILDVLYEDTVADIESQAHRILDFLDLPFEEGVLDFYSTRRLVKTPSASQVRQPIYSDALQSWKKYEKHLGPLIKALKTT